MKRAADAFDVDTSCLNISDACDMILKEFNKKIK
jgi:cytidylate kinase